MKDRMRRLLWKYQDFMRARNGMDDLNQGLWYLFIGVTILQLFLRGALLSMIGTVSAIVLLFRAHSKNLAKRQKENQQYVEMINLVKAKWKNRKEYKVFRCKNCGKLVRVPKGKGKIEASCPRCRQRKICRT